MRAPSLLHKYQAAEIYARVYEDCFKDGLHTDQSILEFMQQHGYWTDTQQKYLEDLPKEIEEFKLKLYENTFKSKERAVIRAALNVAKQKYIEVASQRNAYVHLTCAGVAAISRVKYLVGINLYDRYKRKVFRERSFWKGTSKVLDRCISYINSEKLSEGEFRELSRNDPWRTIYLAGKHEGQTFGRASAELTEDQKILISWSALYDNISQHPDYPNDDVVDDDDMLDGWLIKQKRERDKDRAGRLGDEVLANEKIANSAEIFIPADSYQDAQKVIDKNDQWSRMLLNQKIKTVQAKGFVNECDLPDVQQRLRMQAAGGS